MANENFDVEDARKKLAEMFSKSGAEETKEKEKIEEGPLMPVDDSLPALPSTPTVGTATQQVPAGSDLFAIKVNVLIMNSNNELLLTEKISPTGKRIFEVPSFSLKTGQSLDGAMQDFLRKEWDVNLPTRRPVQMVKDFMNKIGKEEKCKSCNTTHTHYDIGKHFSELPYDYINDSGLVEWFCDTLVMKPDSLSGVIEAATLVSIDTSKLSIPGPLSDKMDYKFVNHTLMNRLMLGHAADSHEYWLFRIAEHYTSEISRRKIERKRETSLPGYLMMLMNLKAAKAAVAAAKEQKGVVPHDMVDHFKKEVIPSMRENVDNFIKTFDRESYEMARNMVDIDILVELDELEHSLLS